MARLPRLTIPGYPHHLIQRGNNRQAIFAVEADYEALLSMLDENARKFGVELHAYVLMTNHFHVLATPGTLTGLPSLMQAVGRRYVRHFNQAQGRTGTLWEGRYRSTLIQADRHLLACMVEIEAGQPEAALVLAQREPERMHRLEGLALAEYFCGRRAESDAALQSLESEFADISPYKLAHIYASRGQPDEAFKWLERAWVHRDPGICWTKVAVLLRPLRDDPRWTQFMSKVGLSDEQLR